MPLFLMEVDYTPEAWANQVKNPQNRIEAVRPAIEQIGGRVVSAYYTFGTYDIIVITEFPDNITAAAFSISVAAGGAVRTRTTPLLSIDDGVAAIEKAGDTPLPATSLSLRF